MEDQEGRFESIEEVSERLLVDPQTVRRWIKSGKLKAYKPGREYRILSSDLDAFLETRSYPKAEASLPLAEESPEQRRSTAFLAGYRAYLGDLWLRRNEPGHKPTPEQIRDAISLFDHFAKSGAFEGPLTDDEVNELSLLLNMANKLRPVAEEFSGQEDEQLVQEINEAFRQVDDLRERVGT